MKADLKTIAKYLYRTCYEVDKGISGLSESDAHFWAKTNSLRHAYTVRELCSYIKSEQRGRPVRILNASGLSAGHQDFSILSYMKECKIDVEWVAYESPVSRHIPNPLFNKYIEELGLRLELIDFSSSSITEKKGPAYYDVILFTEILEHLDHGTMLSTLKSLWSLLKEDGILIITTPNLLSLPNRIRFLLGDGDGPFWGDGHVNRGSGLYGHIAYYDVNRLSRILRDSGFRINTTYTFSCGRGPAEKPLSRRLSYVIVDLLSKCMPKSGSTILVSAYRGDVVKIPFKL